MKIKNNNNNTVKTCFTRKKCLGLETQLLVRERMKTWTRVASVGGWMEGLN